MNELSREEKVAVIKVLNGIMKADNVIHEKEVEYLNDTVESFGLGRQYLPEFDDMSTLEALSIIRGLSPEQKAGFSALMGQMIVVDENIDYNEVKLYITVCDSCNVHKDFDIHDYPEYSLSGPFVNPEDM